jgi:hypothetical protein
MQTLAEGNDGDAVAVSRISDNVRYGRRPFLHESNRNARYGTAKLSFSGLPLWKNVADNFACPKCLTQVANLLIAL